MGRPIYLFAEYIVFYQKSYAAIEGSIVISPDIDTVSPLRFAVMHIFEIDINIEYQIRNLLYLSGYSYVGANLFREGNCAATT